MFWELLRIRTCNCCDAVLDPLSDEGYRCELCYADTSALEQHGDVTDLCSSCMTTKAPDCKQHGPAHIKPSSVVAPWLPAVFPVQLAIPNGVHGVPCKCCGEWHDLVLSYLNPDSMDLHMRPDKGR